MRGNAPAPLAAADAEAMWQGIAAQTLQGLSGYRHLLVRAGFAILSVDDLTEEWAVILRERFGMYRRLREETKNFFFRPAEAGVYSEMARSRDALQFIKSGRLLALRSGQCL